MIYTWAADTAPLLDENRYRAYFEQAPSWRQEKAKKMRFPEDRALSIGAWMLYEKAKKESGLSGENIFNLSHSGHFVLCSIGEDASRKTGCDVEMTGVFRPNVARRFFCPSEWEYIDGRESEEEKRDAFFRYWVLKESFMKAYKAAGRNRGNLSFPGIRYERTGISGCGMFGGSGYCCGTWLDYTVNQMTEEKG